MYFYIKLDGTIYGYHAGNESDLYIPEDGIIGKKMQEFLPASVGPRLYTDMLEILDGKKANLSEYSLPLQKGDQYFEIRFQKISKDEVLAMVRNISNRKEIELQQQETMRQLEMSLKQRELLLQEIHHRVKNNLQIISSLLNLQARAIQDAKLRKAFKDSQQRINAMALVHDMFYNTEFTGKISISEFMSNLADLVFRANKVANKSVDININTAEIFATVDRAIPFGLLIQELISNSLEHGFTEDIEYPKIDLDMRAGSKAGLTISYADNGVGLPDNFSIEKSNSLGLKMVQMLCEQLAGQMKIESKGGVRFTFEFQAFPHAGGMATKPLNLRIDR